MPRVTHQIKLPQSSFGCDRHIVVHSWKPDLPSGSEPRKYKRAYIHASLHADEYPGMLVNHHLIKLLDKAIESNSILNEIIIVPFANPIGLGQRLLGNHVGRFGLETGINFNRDWLDLTSSVGDIVKDKLTQSPEENTEIIRDAIISSLEANTSMKEEVVMKKQLYKLAAVADIVLDLHCDSNAIFHMYTHTRLWPEMSDLAADLQSECTLLDSISGGNPFDEACSSIWAQLADRFPDYPIPMACQSATIELRGELDVEDSLAMKDAQGIYNFLARRNFIDGSNIAPLPRLLRDATPLTGVDMISAKSGGLVLWNVKPGMSVEQGQLLGEILDIQDPYAERVKITSGTKGLIYGMKKDRLCRPGEVLVKVSGSDSLEWRKGHLLNA